MGTDQRTWFRVGSNVLVRKFRGLSQHPMHSLSHRSSFRQDTRGSRTVIWRL